MKIASRTQSLVGWTVWCFHSPLSVFWLVIAALVVASGVDAFRAPREALHLIELAATVAGVVTILARARGISPWPPFLLPAHRSNGLSAAPPNER